MNRFFVDRDRIQDSKIEIIGEDASHILRVLRLGVGDTIELCDGMGLDYTGEIVDIGKNGLIARLGPGKPSRGEPISQVTIYQGIPKGTKMDLIIQKTVELGIHRIVPIETARTITKLDGEQKIKRRLSRWQRIAEEAAKQSRRGIIPRVNRPMSYSDAVQKAAHDVKLALWEEEHRVDFKTYLENSIRITPDTDKRNDKPQNIGFIVGPEGGLEKNEIDLAKENGWEPITLGPRILKTETAGIAALAAIMFYMEEMK